VFAWCHGDFHHGFELCLPDAWNMVLRYFPVAGSFAVSAPTVGAGSDIHDITHCTAGSHRAVSTGLRFVTINNGALPLELCPLDVLAVA
jgi:hypothetical protein